MIKKSRINDLTGFVNPGKIIESGFSNPVKNQNSRFPIPESKLNGKGGTRIYCGEQSTGKHHMKRSLQNTELDATIKSKILFLI